MAKPQLFRHFLGEESYALLPKAIQFFHENSDQKWQGYAVVKGGQNILLKLLRKLSGLPKISNHVPTTISVDHHNGQEIWQRQFGASKFTSIMGFSKAQNLLYEKVGPIRFYFQPTVRAYPESDSTMAIHWDFQYVTFLGCKIPRFLSPVFIGRESVSTNGIYQFKAYVRLPILGVLVDYEGQLTLAKKTKTAGEH
ncbi:DUF4166 domain-containing protein [Ignatzschineria rhizosphaerae]|uniref:DUF4166 domain-containing protein n=1 Tax=Ignatzschineria rhizosphaerae TaxID=2923279 RepID=A0ABY3X8A7_9GAMM|nr:DUF4166 domain-containing protein [Ignatzschineria rhizosphaerae]UNM96961.1 DUF4166 domain-containing protein [Ignatzschineria rhizosphaerae]